MAKKSWGTTFDEDTLLNFQAECEEYGQKANSVMEALMKFFIDGNCKLMIDKGGLQIVVKDK